MSIILVAIILIFIFYAIRRRRGEKFTVIRSEPKTRLEIESDYIDFEPDIISVNDLNMRLAKKNIATGRHAADANRGAQKSRVNYYRDIFEEEFERNEGQDWWEEHIDSSRF